MFIQFENWNLAHLTSRIPDAPLLRWRQRVTNHNQADFVFLAGFSKGIQVGDGDYLESRLLQNRLPHVGEFWVFRGNVISRRVTGRFCTSSSSDPTWLNC